MKRLILVFLIFFNIDGAHLPEANAIQVELSSELSSSEAAQGDIITLTVRLLWIGDPQALQIEPLKNIDTYLLEVTGVTQENTFDMFNDLSATTVLLTYKLKAVEPGKGRISYIALETTEQQTGIKRIRKTQPYDVTILPKSRYLLRQAAYVIWYGLIILGAGVVLWILWRLYARRRRMRISEQQDQETVAVGTENAILLELKNARKYKIAGQSDSFFSAVISALNNYFEQKHSMPMTRTAVLSEDKIESEYNIPRKILIEYKEIVATANRVKFSGVQLSADELEQWARRAEKIIRFFIEKSREDQRKKQIDTITIVSDAGGN